jgi:hypothetical protein
MLGIELPLWEHSMFSSSNVNEDAKDTTEFKLDRLLEGNDTIIFSFVTILSSLKHPGTGTS